MSGVEQMDGPSKSPDISALSRHLPGSQPTSFTTRRPPPLTTTTSSSAPALLSASSSPPSPASSSTSSSSAPLVLSPSDLSSIVALKHNYDTLRVQHTALFDTLAQHDTQLTRLHTQRRADEAEWEQRVALGREQYERVMRDWSEESQKRHSMEESERSCKQQLQEAMDEQRRSERHTRLLEADLANERRMSELMRDKIQKLDQQLTAHMHAATTSSTTRPTADNESTDGDEADTALLSVHKAVLSRRVQRLEMELAATQQQLIHQQAVNTKQLVTLDDINTHLTALQTQPLIPMADTAAGGGGGGEVGVMAEVECVLLRERLRFERREGWRRERKLYVAVLVWLMALLTLSLGGVLLI